LDCAEEVAILKRQLGPAAGEENLFFDVLRARMTVRGPVPEEGELLRLVAETGMAAEPWEETRPEAPASNLRDPFTLLSGLCLLAGYLVPFAVSNYLFGVAALLGAWFILPKAWFAARHFRPDMNFLMTVAVAGAIALGDWAEGATVAFLFAVSNSLEAGSIGRARRAVEALLKIAPEQVDLILAGGHTASTPVSQVDPGQVFRVSPGSRIGLDGLVVNGASEVDQAAITGESRLVPKEAGAEVFAGTINGNGSLDVRATKRSTETTIAKVIRLVEQAQASRSPSETWVERFALIYTPVVLALAIAVALFPPLLLGLAWQPWIYQALVLLVIGCPCALVISTPVSIVAALTGAARQGVLVKGGNALEAAAHLRAIALDKTGTITQGRPVVAGVFPLSGHSERELLEIAAALEANSTHPLARAIREHAAAQGLVPAPATDFKIVPGKGASARLAGEAYWLGSHRYLEELGQETPPVHEELEELSRSGHSVVVIGTADHVCGFIALADGLRERVATTLEELRSLGIEELIMLTGDNEGTAAAVAAASGITAFRAELLPADKLKVIEELVAKWGSVAMVGDGVNDAPAMARSSLGIAMGAIGSDAAIEAADVALMTDDIGRVPWLIRHSRRTLTVIKQNIGLSLSVKFVVAGLALFGYASLWAAIGADMGVSLLVIANGLRLLQPGSSQVEGRPSTIGS
jgi:Cd2+/Zn2+-exporting ATPase